MILAYIDPSTGSLLLSSLVSLGIAVIFSLRGLFYHVVLRFSGKKIGLLPDFTGKLVFYSEGRQYWRVFKPVLEELCRQEKAFVFLTSDEDDPALCFEPSPQEGGVGEGGREYHYVGKLDQATPFLNRLRARLLVMTTPQLGIFQFKRSAYVEHYAHIVHAPTEPHTYRLYAFDLFDSVLCSSGSQIRALRELEGLRGSRPKLLFETGCTYYDELRSAEGAEERAGSEGGERSKGGTVLYAPTWGRVSSLSHAKELIETLLLADYSVIFRPHPQSFASDAEILAELEQYFGEDSASWAGRVEFDRKPTAEESFVRCTHMLCDLSGIVYDFAFLYQKPVFAFDVDWASGGYEAHFLKSSPSYYQILEKTGGKLISPDEISQLPELLLQSKKQAISQDFAGEFVFHFQHAGEVAAKQLLELMDRARNA